MEGLLVIGFIIWIIYMCTKGSKQTTDQFIAEQNMARNMICPHCNTKGSVTTRQVKRKQGISGGKATAAVLTCGISMLGTGLSRKQQMTEASCSHCGMTWSF